MIRFISANKTGFHNTRFDGGVNLVLADRSIGATQKDTTNALGKSTLITIVHFCLGGSERIWKGPQNEALSGWEFTLGISLRGEEFSVTRSVENSGFVIIDGPTKNWPSQPMEFDLGVTTMKIEEWKNILGWALFDIVGEEETLKLRLSTRSLLSYFARAQASAYNDPFKFFDKQPSASMQIHNAFLLGLDWKKVAAWQSLKDRKSALSALKKAIKTGAVSGELSSIGELESERQRLSVQLDREGEALSNFRVHPQYREIESKANYLTTQIQDLVNENVADEMLLSGYEDSISGERAPSEEIFEDFLREVGVVLEHTVVKTLSEAREFNSKIVKHRKDFISSEVESLKEKILERREKIEFLTEERSQYLRVLSGQGALDEYRKLQDVHAITRRKLDQVVNRISQIREMNSADSSLKADFLGLNRSTTLDYEERREAWSKALNLFSECSDALYRVPGNLVIDIGNAGYKFDAQIDGSPSDGINKMRVFCYDLTLISFARIRGLGINFLVHDSTIFDGVDSRQRAHAIELAHEMAGKFGFQYIATMNSDMVPVEDFSRNFDYEKLVRLRLTDTDESGSLLGIRF